MQRRNSAQRRSELLIMYASVLLAAAALVGPAIAVPTATAAPDASILFQRDGKDIDQLSPWVEVNDDAQPVRTFTPVMVTEQGTAVAQDGAPYMLTGSVFSWISYGKHFTSTGAPPNPTATGKNGQGAFSRCENTDGDFAPLCRPSHNSTLLTGNTYYVTWDPDFFPKPQNNITYEVSVRVEWLNHTTNEWNTLETFDRVPAEWGFWAWQLDNKHLRNDHKHDYTNATIKLLQNLKGSNEKNATGVALPVTLEKPGLPRPDATKAPTGDTLKIALPAALGSVFLLSIGLCLCNRRTRHIGLGNVMSRARHGYTGKSRRRMFRRNKDHGIQLDTRPVPPEGEYRDNAPPRMPRRDSDDLDSLAGSPVVSSFHQQGTTGGRNAFRDEMSRQDRLRQEERRY
ncbi:hypothetical protein HJFPF1_01289 [Paramyrothecium foliicola]|nr:hypothetical protein HJFPF1_01289 [Paramyrothecium foliicola]